MECDKRMESDYIYGVVVNNMLYSNRVQFAVEQDNGIYSMDMSKDDFRETLAPANIDDARKYFSNASKVEIIRGISFHDGLIPENPVAYEKLPLRVVDATYDDFEEVEVALVRGKVCYFLQLLSTDKAYPLMDLKDRFESETPSKFEDIKGVTPEMRVVYTFYLLEKRRQEMAILAEKRRKELAEPVNAIRHLMTTSGATVKNVKKVNRGFEVNWNTAGWDINTLLDKNFRVLEAGFCVSGHDKTQSATSVVKLLQDYVEDGHSYVHHTRVAR